MGSRVSGCLRSLQCERGREDREEEREDGLTAWGACGCRARGGRSVFPARFRRNHHGEWEDRRISSRSSRKKEIEGLEVAPPGENFAGVRSSTRPRFPLPPPPGPPSSPSSSDTPPPRRGGPLRPLAHHRSPTSPTQRGRRRMRAIDPPPRAGARPASYSARSPTGGGEWPFDHLHGVNESLPRPRKMCQMCQRWCQTT